jgi:hypothetical protein
LTPWATQEQAVTDERVEIACVDSGYIGLEPVASAAKPDIELVVVKTTEAKQAIVLPQHPSSVCLAIP